MLPESNAIEEIVYPRDEVIKPWLITKNWRPRFTLGSVILFMSLAGLSASYYAKVKQTERQKRDYETRLRQQKGMHSWTMRAYQDLLQVPSPSQFDFVKVFHDGQQRDWYKIFLNLDPSKSYLLHFANDKIPLSGTPAPQQTYSIPAVGDKDTSRNYLMFQVCFYGTGFDYKDVQPFVGEIQIETSQSCFSNPGEQTIRHQSSWLNPKFMSVKSMTVPKYRAVRDWLELFLESKRDAVNIRPGISTQLIRIRSNLNDPEPSQGVMLWLEELGNQPVPPDALPFQSKP
jgi:hypothetical protein